MIIATKLHIPRSRTELVSRPRLYHRLAEGLSHVLTLVTAPAGYGKTTLLSEWAMTMDHPVAWVSLDQGDNDRMRFWVHTMAALKQAYPSFDKQAVLRFAREDTTGDSLIAALINSLHRVSHPIVLIWDDFHHIENPTIQQGIVYLLHRLPPHVHLYIASRIKPTLPLSRLKVEAGLNSIDENDLRFDATEASEFFLKCSEMKLSKHEILPMQQRTEGWIVAMRLAVLSMNESADPTAIVQKITGTDRDISDYFFDEVLSQQSETIMRFLLQTSILDRMTSELCAAVTGIAESAECLQWLEQQNLFLVPLDERREWYRYHHLFQQFLLAQLNIREPHQWKNLHIAAGKWLEEYDYSHEAVHYYLSADQHEAALRLIESLAPDMMVHEWTTLCTWLSAIPDSLLLAKPKMLLTKLAAQYLAGQTEAATDGYRRAVRMLEESTTSYHVDEMRMLQDENEMRMLQAGLAFLAAIRAFLDRNFEDAVHYSKAYVEGHPEGDLFVGFGSDQDGYHPVWNVYASDDSLRMAEQVLPPLLSIWSETQNVYLVAHFSIDFGKLLYERNRLDEAEKYIQRAHEIGRTHDNFSLMTIASLWLARITAVRGDTKTAQGMVKQIAQQTTLRASPQLSGKVAWYSAMEGRLLGKERPVREWRRTSDLRSEDEIPLSMLKEYDLLACYLAEQGKTKEAVSLIERMLYIANEAGKQSDKIRLLVHKTMILSLQGKRVQSMDVLEEALALAWPEKYIRTFVDEGMPVCQLLDQYLKLRQSQHYRTERKVPLSYVKRLLRHFVSLDGDVGDLLLKVGHNFELTEKERDVLQLIETGLSNKEIGEQLHISLATVKTHINNIYGKLQVNNRLQALERARTLKLF